MTPEQFVYWLQGFFEIRGVDQPVGGLSQKQVAIINEHLQLVFDKVTGGGSFGDGSGGVRRSDVGHNIYDNPTGQGIMTCSNVPETSEPLESPQDDSELDAMLHELARRQRRCGSSTNFCSNTVFC